MKNSSQPVSLFAQLFDADAYSAQSLVLAEDAADLDRAAGRYRLSCDGDAHRPHYLGVLAPARFRHAGHRGEDALVVPVLNRLEHGEHFAERLKRAGLVGLGLFVDVQRRVVIGKSVEKVELFGDVGEHLRPLLEQSGYRRGVEFGVFHRLTDEGLGCPGKGLGAHGADIFAVEVFKLFNVEDGGRLGYALYVENFGKLGQGVYLPFAAGAPAQQGDVVDHRGREIALRDEVLIGGVAP